VVVRSAARLAAAFVTLTPLSVRADEPPAPPASSTPSAPSQTIVVTANRLNVETLIDRKVYSVGADVQSTFGTVSDVLTAIPSVDVDSEGVVSLRGDSNVLILIDGKPSSLFSGPGAGDNLQSIPAKDIERIEVITNPPAKFKAEGTAGIINIVTKKHRTDGFAGTAQASLGSGGRYAFGTSLTLKSGPLTLTASGSFRQDYRHRLIESDLRAPDPTTGIVTDSHSTIDELIRREVPPYSVTAEYALSDLQTISASASHGSRYGLRTYTELDGTTDAGGLTSGSNRRLSAGHDTEVDYDVLLGFTQKFSRAGEKLEISAERSNSRETEHYDYINDSFVPMEPTAYTNLGFHAVRGTSEIDVDYELPFTKTELLQLGYAYELDQYDYGAAGYSLDPATGTIALTPSTVDGFRYRQQIHSAYATYKASIRGWNWQGGLRGELTQSDARQLTESFSNSVTYCRLYPSLNVVRPLSDATTLSLGASRRISRPDPGSLDPYVDPEYSPNLRAGNAYLLPQYTQSYEAGYGYDARGRTLALTGYYRRNTDSATDVTENLGNGVTLTTRANLPRNDSGGVEFGATGTLAGSLAYSLSGNLFYSEIDATQLGVPGLRSTTGINAKVKLDWRLGTRDTAQLTLSRTDKRLTPQGEVDAINIVNLGYRHHLVSQLTAVATLSDAFNGQRYRRLAVTPTFADDYRRFVHGRIAYVGVVYNFGSTRKDRPAGFEYDE